MRSVDFFRDRAFNPWQLCCFVLLPVFTILWIQKHLICFTIDHTWRSVVELQSPALGLLRQLTNDTCGFDRSALIGSASHLRLRLTFTISVVCLCWRLEPLIKVAFWDPDLLRIIHVDEMVRGDDLLGFGVVLGWRALIKICCDNFFQVKICLRLLRW